MAEGKRDLHADLSICEAATAGPWRWSGDKWGDIVVYSPELRGFHNNGGEIAELDCEQTANATFIAEARTGWPHAVERALAAEAKVEMWYAETVAESLRADTAEQRCRDLTKLVDELSRKIPVTFEQAAETLRIERKLSEIFDSPEGDRRRREITRHYDELTGRGER